MKLLTFALGAALLIGLGMLANDPLWTWWSSLLAAAAACPDLAIGNAVAATPLFLAVGLVAIVDLRRHWLPAGAAAACCTVALLSWVPW